MGGVVGPGPSRVRGREVEQMSRIAVIITDMFQDVEYERPAEAFRKAGHELTHVGFLAGSLVKGEHGMTVRIDRAVRDVSVGDFDALFIPGGYSPDKLRIDEAAVRFAGEFVTSGKPVFAICHAAQLLITARVLGGRRVTGWKSIIQDIKNAGAEYIDKEVVVDRNLVSSRKPDDIPAFIQAALEMLKKVK
jgi:protease I